MLLSAALPARLRTQSSQPSRLKDGSMSFHSVSLHPGLFGTHDRETRNRRVLVLVFAQSLTLAAGAVYPSLILQASAALPAAFQGDSQPLSFDACTVFSAADAAQVLGLPLRPITHVGA